MENLLRRVINAHSGDDLLSLPPDLYGGSLGIALFQAMCYADGFTDEPPQGAIRVFSDAIDYCRTMPDGLLHGSLGALWSLAFLWRNEVIDVPCDIMRLARETVGYNSRYFYDSPFRYRSSSPLYPFGVAMMPLWSDEDTVSRYDWEEQIILRLCDCEKILCQNLPGIHDCRSLSASMLHSIAAFCQMASRRRIFPFKADELLRYICGRHYAATGSDALVLGLMTGQKSLPGLAPGESPVSFLDYAGLLSVIYEQPELFEAAMRLFPIDDLTYDNNLPVGIGLGILNCMKK